MTNPNDPAVPTNKSYTYNDPQAGDYTMREDPMYPGLTKREYFAAQALRGAIEWHGYHERPESTKVENIAKDCVGMADALIIELNKEVKP